MSLHRLPSVPPTIRFLTTQQSTRLDEVYPSRSKYRCETCKDTSRFVWYVPDTERDITSIGEYECNCADQFRLRRRFRYSGIPESAHKLSWDDYIWGLDSVFEACVDYLEHLDHNVYSGLGLCFSGNRGTGKTMAAMMLAKQLVVEGHDVYTQTFAGMLEAFSSGWKDRADRVWFNERVRNASILVIDDLGKERNQGIDSMGSNALEEVLRHRVQRDLPTMFTTNYSEERLLGGYGGSTADLMLEKVTIVEALGTSAREAKAARDRAERDAGITRPVLM